MAKAYPAEFAILPPGPKTPPSAGFEQSVRLNSENPEEAMSIEWDGTYRKREAKVGAGRPYGMRKRFKGHRHEREARVRKIDVKERLEGMEDRIESWKKVCVNVIARMIGRIDQEVFHPPGQEGHQSEHQTVFTVLNIVPGAIGNPYFIITTLS
jgi:hypothetical protein